MRRTIAPTRPLALLMAIALVTALSACGKKANLDPPPGEPSRFPRVYPYRAIPAAPGQQREDLPQQPQPETEGEAPPSSLLLPQPALPPPTSP